MDFTRGSKGSRLDFSVIFKQLLFMANHVYLLFIRVKKWKVHLSHALNRLS